MWNITFILCLVLLPAVAESLTLFSKPENTTCLATHCSDGTECRIIVESSSLFGPRCVDPEVIANNGRRELCGHSGHPLLRPKKKAGKKKYRIQKFKSCTVTGLVFANRICCADTEKAGMCPPAAANSTLDNAQTTNQSSPEDSDLQACTSTCEGDNQCGKEMKCCRNSCGVLACVEPLPLITCRNTLCGPGTTCIDNENGPRCVPGDTYKLPKVVGPCRAAFPRFYYNTETKNCTPFIYGGCRGNDNNFQTMDNCEKACASWEADKCLLPKATGLCRALLPRFHFDSEAKECNLFFYGGCAGNDNNFQTKESCEKACEKHAV